MTSDNESEFPARLFPTSFTLLYCPFLEVCPCETPFTDPLLLVEHVSSEHGMEIRRPEAVLPLLDRYLAARLHQASPGEEEDSALRYRLQQERLQEILNLQARERAELYRTGRHCLFCNLHLDTHPHLFAHMYKEHGFNIGHLDNLAMVGEFLDTLQKRLDQRICIYCEGRFPSLPTLKKHLKNKNHYRIHPQNHLYDKYYIVNYLLPGTLYDVDAAEREEEGTDAERSEGRTSARRMAKREEEMTAADQGAAWEELDEPLFERTICLLCPLTQDTVEDCLEHMQQVHQFDWEALIVEESLDETDTIQLVNYMRDRQIDQICPYCPLPLEDRDEGGERDRETLIDKNDNTADDDRAELSQGTLVEKENSLLMAHLNQCHCPFRSLPSRSLWSLPRYLFPTLEDDPLLWYANSVAIEQSKGETAVPPLQPVYEIS